MRERERIRSYELLPRMEQDIFFSSSFLFLWRIILGGSCTSRHGCGGSPIGGGSKRNLLEIFARDRWRERERGRECVCVCIEVESGETTLVDFGLQVHATGSLTGAAL